MVLSYRPDRDVARARISESVSRLNERTTAAMLRGLRRFPRIAAGAYSLRDKEAVCPLLAAHRCGAMEHELDFAPAWDGFVASQQRIRLGGSPVDQQIVAELVQMLGEHLERISGRPAFECDSCGEALPVDALGACHICGSPLSGPDTGPAASSAPQSRSARVPTTAS